VKLKGASQDNDFEMLQGVKRAIQEVSSDSRVVFDREGEDMKLVVGTSSQQGQ